MNQCKINHCFNPRPPRGGRQRVTSGGEIGHGFNPRPPRGGRPQPTMWRLRLPCSFNPRPPRGGRRDSRKGETPDDEFQSTPPAWGATQAATASQSFKVVSIHAPRVGGDIRIRTYPSWLFCFNPRPPRGGRQLPETTIPSTMKFQSTPPAWGATLYRQPDINTVSVSIHAPRVGGDGAGAAKE